MDHTLDGDNCLDVTLKRRDKVISTRMLSKCERPRNRERKIAVRKRDGIPKKFLIENARSHLIGRLIEDRFFGLMKAIIQQGMFPELVSCKRAPKNEDQRHQTDFKLRMKHPQGYNFYMRVQVKGSRNYLIKHGRGPLPPDIVLVIMDKGSNVFSLMSLLSNAYREKIKVEQERV